MKPLRIQPQRTAVRLQTNRQKPKSLGLGLSKGLAQRKDSQGGVYPNWTSRHRERKTKGLISILSLFP